MDQYTCPYCNRVVTYNDNHPCFTNMMEDIGIPEPLREEPEEQYKNDANDECEISLEESKWESLNKDKYNFINALDFVPPNSVLLEEENIFGTLNVLDNSDLQPFDEEQGNDMIRQLSDPKDISPEVPFDGYNITEEMGKNDEEHKSFKKDDNAAEGPSTIRSSPKVYGCVFCSRQFKHKGNFQRHSRTHTGEKPFVCEICGTRFTQKVSLDTHYRIHTGDLPYVCDWCEKAFARKIGLDVHIRSHTREKPFKCTACGKAFSTRSNCKQHTRICKSKSNIQITDT